MDKRVPKNMEFILLFILVTITVMEFLVYAGGISGNEILLSLNVMIGLMLFGSSLLIVTILIRIYELIIYFTQNYVNDKGGLKIETFKKRKK